MIREPRLDQREFDRVRDLRLNRLLQMSDMPPALADRAFTQLLYRRHPYGHLPIGSESAAAHADPRQRDGLPSPALTCRPTTVIAAGDASHDDLIALVERAFDGWHRGPAWPAERRRGPGRRRRPADAPGARAPAGRGAVRAADRPRVGGAGTSRLPPAARAQHDPRRPVRQPDQHEPARGQGLHLRRAHGVRARRGPGRSCCRRACSRTPPPRRCARASREIAAIRGDRPVTREELEIGRAALTRGYPRNFETADQVAPRRRAARAVRPAGRLLHDLRPEGPVADEQRRRPTRAAPPYRSVTAAHGLVGDRDRIGARRSAPLGAGRAGSTSACRR